VTQAEQQLMSDETMDINELLEEIGRATVEGLELWEDETVSTEVKIIKLLQIHNQTLVAISLSMAEMEKDIALLKGLKLSQGTDTDEALH